MSINNVDIYDFGAWIDLAPEFDWDDLHPVAEDPEDPEEPVDPEDPESGE